MIGKEAQKLNEAFDQTGVKVHDRAAALAAFKQNREITFENGEPFSIYDGEVAPLSECLLKYFYDNRSELFDARTLPRSGVGFSRPGLASKADYPDVKSRSAAIAQNGLQWWERLPATGVATNEVLTQADWLKLPVKERVRRRQADPTAFEKLARSPAVRAGGVFINHDALNKELATRGKR